MKAFKTKAQLRLTQTDIDRIVARYLNEELFSNLVDDVGCFVHLNQVPNDGYVAVVDVTSKPSLDDNAEEGADG